jgi:hypothetical protein
MEKMGKKKGDVFGTMKDALKAAGVLVLLAVAIYIFYQNTEDTIKVFLYGRESVVIEKAAERIVKGSGPAYRYLLEAMRKSEDHAYGTKYRTGPGGESEAMVMFHLIDGHVVMVGRYSPEAGGPEVISIQDRDLDGAPDGFLPEGEVTGIETNEEGYYRIGDGEEFFSIRVMWHSGVRVVARAIREGVAY